MARGEALRPGTQEISASRWKTSIYLAGSLAFVAIAAWLLQQPRDGAWKLQLGLIFFGACSVAFVWMLIRPQRLLLDDEGFTLTGGFLRAPTRIRWAEVEEFFVHRLPRGGEMIGYTFVPGESARSMLAKLNRRLGADACLPKGWPVPAERMVDELNARRLRALRDA